MENDPDPVIKEMDVVLDLSLTGEAKRLVLLHFPLSSPSEELHLSTARYKPQINMLQVEKPLPEESPDMDPDKESSGKIIYNSTRSKNHNSLILCSVKNGQLHWLPFHSVLTMKPAYPELDAQMPEEADSDPAEARAINMRFASIRGPRGNSFQHYQQRVAQEPWTDLQIQENGDIPSPVSEPSEQVSQVTWEKLDFEKAFDVANCTQQQELNTILKRLLTKVLVVEFEELMTYLHQYQQGNWTKEEVFSCLIHQAYYLQYCWVAKSELLFPEFCHGLPPSTLVQIRDYLLWRFTLSPTVSKSELQGKILVSKEPQKKISLDMLTTLLETLAKPLPEDPDTWEFLLSCPPSPLSNRFQESIDRQQQCWKRRFRNFSPKDCFYCK